MIEGLRKDEEKLIMLMRRSQKYCTFRVEKRPSKEFPDGELQRVIVEDSVLLGDIALNHKSATV
jgi:hypothetical protein